MAIASRDFVEKSIHFYQNGKFYKFACSVPNSELGGPGGQEPLYPSPDNYTVRGFTLLNASIVQRNSFDGSITMTGLVQCDFKLRIPQFMITTFLPRATRQWLENINKYYKKNNKL